MLNQSNQSSKKTLPGIRRIARGLALGAGIALAGIGGAAHAQNQTSSTQVNEPFAIKAGVFVPSGPSARRYGSDVTFALEGAARIQSLPENNAATFVNVGYITSGSDFKIVPITLSEIFRDPNQTSRFKYYYGLGAGVYITQLKDPSTREKNIGLFGGFLTAGIDTGGPVFAEVKYHLISRYDTKNVSGTQVTVGVRL